MVQLSVQMVSFNSIRSWTEHLVPILISFYIGSWSDHFGIDHVILLTFDCKSLTVGRKPFLALCMVGKLGGAVFNLLNAIYLEEWSRWVDTKYSFAGWP